MAMTLHRTDRRGDTLSVKRLLGDMYDISPNVAQGLSSFGKLGYAIAYMVNERRKTAARDEKAQSILRAKEELQNEIDAKTAPVMTAMKAALPEGTTVDLVAFASLAQAVACQEELAKIAALDAQLDALSIQHKDAVIDKALVNLMGKENSQGSFPDASTVYTVENNTAQGWPKTAFVVGNDTGGARVFVQNGESYEEIADLTGISISSKRFCQKVAYVLHGMADGYTTATSYMASWDDNYNPFEGIRPKAKANVSDMALKDWVKANGITL